MFYHIYADESRQLNHRFMLFGAILLPRGEVENAFLADVEAFRLSRKWNHEMTWHKVSPGATSLYVDFVDLFFAHPEVEFRCLAVDTHQIDYQRYHENDKERCFYTFYEMFLSRNMKPEHRYLVFTDERSDREQHRLSVLREGLNRYGREQGAVQNIVANVEPRDSKKHDPLQMADLLLGAVGYAIEEYTTSEAKKAVIERIESRLGVLNLREHRGRDTRFNIWVFNFQKVKVAEKEKGRPDS